MNIFLLKRKNLIRQTEEEKLNFKKFKFVCVSVIVYAENEQNARKIAAKPAPKFGKKVRVDNTIDNSYSWCYDTESKIWLDHLQTDCLLTTKIESKIEKVQSRNFIEIGVK